MASEDETGPVRKCRRTAPRALHGRADESADQVSSLEQWLQRAFAWGHVCPQEAPHSQSRFFTASADWILCHMDVKFSQFGKIIASNETWSLQSILQSEKTTEKPKVGLVYFVLMDALRSGSDGHALPRASSGSR